MNWLGDRGPEYPSREGRREIYGLVRATGLGDRDMRPPKCVGGREVADPERRLKRLGQLSEANFAKPSQNLPRYTRSYPTRTVHLTWRSQPLFVISTERIPSRGSPAKEYRLDGCQFHASALIQLYETPDTCEWIRACSASAFARRSGVAGTAEVVRGKTSESRHGD